ncbi:MAG: hypothetical protein WEB03_14195 [Nitriliruptor sp.]|uniref:hypothetical protein n=1 Tax=Nitriliruptor sp. TaxID=2448056 RepID=UPI00349FDAF4
MSRSVVPLRAVATLLIAVFGLLLLSATGAAAHTRTQETTNLDSRITDDPHLPGVSWTVHTGGLLIEVVNTGDEVLVVEGYEGEPYLRLGPDGTERNRRSPTTYLNDERLERRLSSRRDVAMPRNVDPAAEPEWIAIDDEPRALWHDHRVHWMSPAPPRFVEAGPIARAMMRVNLVGAIGRAGDDAGVFQTWSIPLVHGDRTAVLAGEMAWDDPPSAWPWLVAAALLVAPGVLGLRRRDPVDVLRPAALVVLLVATFNGIHLIDDLVAWPSNPLDELSGLLHTMLFLGTGFGAALWALRVDHGRALALAIASGALLYHQGIVHLPMLNASHFPTVWPQAVVRLAIALGVAQAIVVAIVIRRARHRGTRPAVIDDSGPADRARIEAVTTT